MRVFPGAVLASLADIAVMKALSRREIRLGGYGVCTSEDGGEE